MNKMPGFTAQVSLYKTSQLYRTTGSDTSSTGQVQLMFHKTFVRELLDIPLYVYTIDSPILCEINYKKCMEKCSRYTPHNVPSEFEGIYDEKLGVVGGKYNEFCRLQCEHHYNCGADRVCLRGECCRKEKVCGNVCCGDEEVCNPVFHSCCPKNQVCGEYYCCGGNSTCVEGTFGRPTCCPKDLKENCICLEKCEEDCYDCDDGLCFQACYSNCKSECDYYPR